MLYYSYKQLEITETEVLDLLTNISNLTSKPDAYYGHEILDILNIITVVLDKPDSEMMNMTIVNANFEENNLPLQINTFLLIANIMNNLISNYFQWDQLSNVFALHYVTYLMK